METESSVTYDERRKLMTHKVVTTEDAKNKEKETIGEVTTTRIGIYKGESVKEIYDSQKIDVKVFEEGLKLTEERLVEFDKVNGKTLEELKEIEEDEEVKKLKETMAKSQKLQQKEKLDKSRKAIVDEIEERKKMIKFSQKNERDIREAVGSRLKLQ